MGPVWAKKGLDEHFGGKWIRRGGTE